MPPQKRAGTIHKENAMKKKLTIIAALVLVFALGAGAGILASGGGYGSQEDPLITKSYLNKTVSEEIDSAFDSLADDYASELEEKLSDFEDDIRSAIGSDTVSESDVFSVLTLGYGDEVVCGVGTEIMLRIGAAEAVGEDYPVLVDLTDSSSVGDGSSLYTNHMYMVTIKDNGIRATSGTVKVLIRGEYTVD